jgi:signal transduction histidine kinase/heme-degrading monooxygenase HmoA
MVAVLSRFRVANAMEADVARAFRQRPRAVEKVPGFLWLEVFADHADPAMFYLLTRWTDLDSFERWHGSPAHRDSHALIPKALKLDPSWTTVYRLDRLDGVTGPPLAEAIADAPLLVASYASAASGVYLFVVDRDARIRTCNPAACDSLAAGATLDGQPLTDYMPAPDAVRLRDLLAEDGRQNALRQDALRLNFAAPKGVPFTLDCWIRVHADGATLVGQPAFRREQQLQDELMAINQELAVLSRERSREARDERFGREAAERFNRERNVFLRVLAHELRQPIGSALAAMGVLRKMNPDPGLERPRGLVERQLMQMNRLVEDLADSARLASGDIDLRRTSVDLTRLLRELSTVWEAVSVEQHKSFSWQLPETPLVVPADTDRLQQVFSNLVGNAFKYTPPGGAVAVSLDVDNGFAVVTIADEGEGIPAERLPRIFELFQRETTTGSGLGVGLAVVKALVEAHGGSVSAASAGLGRGSTFTVRLPRR